MFGHAILISTFAAALGVAAAQPAAAPTDAAVTTENRNMSQAKVCRKMGPALGSRLGGGRMICKTQFEWDAMEQDAEDALRNAVRKPCDAGKVGIASVCG